MGGLFRRDDTVPVQARRRGDDVPVQQSDPILIEVPAGQPPIAPPPPRPGVTQNIVYVVAPQSPGLPAENSPREVHYHTTNNYEPVRRRRLEKGTSFLGSLSIVIGLLACATAYIGQLAAYAKPIAQVGLVLGGIGLLLAILFRRVGRGTPALGVLISAIAFPIWLSKTGQLQGQYDQLRDRSPMALPAFDFGGNPAEKTTSQGVSADPAQRIAPIPAGADITHRSTDHSIFGDGAGGWTKPLDVKVRNGLAGSNNEGTSTGTALPDAPSLEKSAALANLEAARTAAAQRQGLNYSAAKAVSAAATEAYKQAQIRYSMQSPELVDAVRKKIAASSELNQIEKQLDADPTVAAAELAVKESK